MKKLVTFLATFVLNLNAFASCFAADNSFVTPCFDEEIIFVRGSGAQQYYSQEFLELRSAGKRLTEDFNLSSLTWDLEYPAVAIDSPARLIGAFVSAGKAYEYGDSVRAGVDNLKVHYQTQHANCPDMKYILVGYSQGATVVADALGAFVPESVEFVMMLGDPNTYLPEGSGLFPAACNGGKLSSYRTFAPNCRTYKGVFGAREPYEVDGFTGKFSLWCNRQDYICGSSKNPLKNAGHTAYVDQIGWGFAYLSKKYLKRYVPTSSPMLRSALRSAPLDDYLDNKIVNDEGGAQIAAPADVSLWRAGDVLRLSWQVPSNASGLLLRLNGVDLGYADASLGAFEIRDVDFSADYSLSLAWMDDAGELSEISMRNSHEISDTPNEIVSDNSTGGQDGASSADEVNESVEQAGQVGRAEVFESSEVSKMEFSSTNTPSPDFLELESVATSHGGDVVAQSPPLSSANGLSFANQAGIAGIVFSALGALGLLLLFTLRKRRGA